MFMLKIRALPFDIPDGRVVKTMGMKCIVHDLEVMGLNVAIGSCNGQLFTSAAIQDVRNFLKLPTPSSSTPNTVTDLASTTHV